MDRTTVDDAVRLVDLRESALDVGEVLDAVADDAAGGVTVFVGRVRNHDGGEQVTHLDYTAHPTAREQLEAVCAGVATEYDVHGLAAVHRVGRLEIGDAAVVVATAAAHRGVAFEASRAILDRLEAAVAIW